MTALDAAAILGSSTLAQLCAGWAAVLPIGALALYGWYRGAFLATIAGLQVLASFLAAVACALPAARLVASLGCPEAQALAVGYAVVFAVGIVGIRLAVGAGVPDGACKLAPLFDQVAGIVVGAAGGLALGGALLVGWSMAELPAWVRLDTSSHPVDSGSGLLWTFARFAGRGADSSKLLLDGDLPAAAGTTGGVIRASEPFADTNRNGTWDAGAVADEGEPYLDVDGNGGFTRDLGWQDATGDGRRSAGLRDCYRLADWRHVRVMHAPRIDSAATCEVVENTPIEEPIYEARASDVDGDAVTFGIEPAAEGEAPGVVVEPATGAVTLVETADFERAKSHEFVVVATDATGQSARQRVRLRVRDVPLESSDTR